MSRPSAAGKAPGNGKKPPAVSPSLGERLRRGIGGGYLLVEAPVGEIAHRAAPPPPSVLSVLSFHWEFRFNPSEFSVAGWLGQSSGLGEELHLPAFGHLG